jgi:hypothetical protein
MLSVPLFLHSFHFRSRAPVELKLIILRHERNPRPFDTHSLGPTKAPHPSTYRGRVANA